MKSHLLEESLAVICLLRFAFYLYSFLFWGSGFKASLFLPPKAALKLLPSPRPHLHHAEEQRSVVINRICIILLPRLRLKSKMQLKLIGEIWA